MAYEASTAGIIFKYAVEATAGTFPTSGFTAIPNVKGIPAFDMAPSALDATDLSDTEWKKYIFGLKDPGGDIAIDVNLTSDLKTKWTALKSAADTGWSAGKSCWFEIKLPGWTDSFYFAGRPAPIGIGALSVDSILGAQAHIAPTEIKGWATAST